MLQRLEYQSLWRRFNSLVVYLDVLCMSPSVLFSTWLLKNKLRSQSAHMYILIYFRIIFLFPTTSKYLNMYYIYKLLQFYFV